MSKRQYTKQYEGKSLSEVFGRAVSGAKANGMLYVRFPEGLSGSAVQTFEDIKSEISPSDTEIVKAWIQGHDITYGFNPDIERTSEDPNIQEAIDMIYITVDELKIQGDDLPVKNLEWTPV